jgi:hypothetical protein
MNERQRQILILNGVALLVGSVLVGWVFFFFLLKQVVLWPVVPSMPVEIPGDERGWRMAHMEGITHGLLLLALGAVGGRLRLGARAAGSSSCLRPSARSRAYAASPSGAGRSAAAWRTT